MAVLVSFLLRLDVSPRELLTDDSPYNVVGAMVIISALFLVLGLVSKWFWVSLRSNLLQDVRRVCFISFGLASCLMLLLPAMSLQGIPRSLALLVPLCFFAMLISSRAVLKVALVSIGDSSSRDEVYGWIRGPVAVMGVSEFSREIARQLRVGGVDVEAFVASDKSSGQPTRIYKFLDSIPVVSVDLLKKRMSERAVLSIVCRNLSADLPEDLREFAVKTNVALIRSDSIGMRWPYKAIMDLTVDDLFNDRSSFALDEKFLEDLRGLYGNKTILVTGGGGSIGGSLVRLLASMSEAKLVILDSSEYNLYRINKLVGSSRNSVRLVLGSVTDEPLLQELFEAERFDVVFHAAALKHVSIVDDNPQAGYLVNVFGTKLVASVASRAGVSDFVFISTDKAVSPTTLMGATKRLAEIALSSIQLDTQMSIRIVRFGNVSESSGSVIPSFKESLLAGSGIEVTDPAVRRFFMSLHEAASLIVSTLLIGLKSSDNNRVPIYVLDMGNPIYIDELAKRLVNFSGLRWGDHVGITYGTLKFGDKSSEELESASEILVETDIPKLRQTFLHCGSEEQNRLQGFVRRYGISFDV